jgi:pyruvate formate lyase activating enzyme
MLTAWSSLRGITPFSLCDWPGRDTCVLFLGGCSMRCPTCHNADLAWRPEWLPALDKAMVMDHLRERKGWLDGVVISGGEPTECRDLAFMLREIRSTGLPVKVDTNGMQPQAVADLLRTGLADAFSVDVKGPWAKYPELTGNQVDPQAARRNLSAVFELAQAQPHAFQFRTTRVPLLNDNDIEEARGYLPAGFTLRIQEYVAPRRTKHAETDLQTGRMSGDVVSGTYRQRHPQGAQGQRHQGPAARQAACA